MTYGYLRVSTDQQDENNQKVGVDEKANRMGLKIDEYIIDHGVSGTKEPEKRELGTLMKKLKKDDLIIASELSRLGRSMYMVMRILEFCMKNGIKVITVKDNYELVDNIQSKVLAFAFSIAAEIERDMISRRTKEALARVKASGKKLGRKFGKCDHVKLTGHDEEICEMIREGKNNVEIGQRFGVHRQTVRYYIRDRQIFSDVVKNRKIKTTSRGGMCGKHQSEETKRKIKRTRTQNKILRIEEELQRLENDYADKNQKIKIIKLLTKKRQIEKGRAF